MTDSNTPHISIPKPIVSAQTGPKDYQIPAGKTAMLVDNNKNVVFLKSTDKEIRIFTQWTLNVYDDNASALADIEKNKWTYNPQPHN